MLFIVIGIKWSVMTVTWLSGNISNYISYAVNLMDIVQNFFTFIIFVWKKKIKRMLLKRFGCSVFITKARYATNATSSSASTHTITSGEMSVQEKINSCEQRYHHMKNSYDGTEL